MSTINEAYEVLKKMIEDLQARRLFESANDVMTKVGREALDPIHFIIAATQDRYIEYRSEVWLEARGINRSTALRASHLAREVDAVQGNGVITTFNQDTIEMLVRLGAAREEFLQVRERHPFSSEGGDWSWYHQLLREAVESASPAAMALREHISRN